MYDLNKPLATRQAAFVQQYLVDLNATQAAIRAGYSIRTARAQGQRMLTNVDIQAEINQAIEKRTERTQVTQDQVVKELARIAFSNISDYVSWGPDGVTLKDSGELQEGASAAVAEVSEHRTESGRTVRFKLHHKLKALYALAKHLGMFDKGNHEITERVRVTRVTIGPQDHETQTTESVYGGVARFA